MAPWGFHRMCFRRPIKTSTVSGCLSSNSCSPSCNATWVSYDSRRCATWKQIQKWLLAISLRVFILSRRERCVIMNSFSSSGGLKRTVHPKLESYFPSIYNSGKSIIVCEPRVDLFIYLFLNEKQGANMPFSKTPIKRQWTNINWYKVNIKFDIEEMCVFLSFWAGRVVCREV